MTHTNQDEERVRAALRQIAEQAPTANDVARRLEHASVPAPDRRRAWALALVAAATVAVVGVGGWAASEYGVSQHQAPVAGPSVHTGVVVSVGGYEIDVPDSWRASASGCGASSSQGGVVVRGRESCPGPFQVEVDADTTLLRRVGNHAVYLSGPVRIAGQTVFEVTVPDEGVRILVHAVDPKIARIVAEGLRPRRS